MSTDLKISQMTSATTPLAGTEVLPIVQSGGNRKVAVSDLTAGRPISATQYTSTVATGTAPLIVSSTTAVANLTASNVVTNANLTGAVTSVGNATSLGSFTSTELATALTDETGTGVAVFSTSPSLTTPNLTAARCPFSTLTDAATVAVDLALGNNFNLVLGGNRTLGVPTNPVAGQSGVISVRQDSTGSRTLAYAWPYEFVGNAVPTLSTGKYVVDQLTYVVNSYKTSTVTIAVSSPGIVGWTAHGLVSGQRIQFTTTGTLPTGLSPNTTYWISISTANSFYVASSLANLQAGTFVNVTGAGSGTHTATNFEISIGIDRLPMPVNAQTGTTYTLTAHDCGKIITLSNASAITLTLPQQSTAATVAGYWVHVRNIGVGTVTIVKEGAETLTGNTSLITNSEAIIERPTTTSWTTFGGTATVSEVMNFAFTGAIVNQAYDIAVKMPFAGTIIGLTSKVTSLGTAGNYTVAISGVNVTGLAAITNTTARTTTAATAANTFVAGDYITLTMASTVTVVDCFGSLEYTRVY